MAHEEALKFENLTLDQNYPKPSGLIDNGHTFSQDGNGWRTAQDLASTHCPSLRGVEGSDGVLSDLHIPTPPIPVPVPVPEEQHFRPGPTDDLEYNHNPRYMQPSPLEQFARNDQHSIIHNPEFSFEVANSYPPEKPTINTNVVDVESSADYIHRRNHGSENSANAFPITPPCKVFFSSMEDSCVGASVPAGERPTSLTSLSTASAITDEIRTPPEAARDILLSPFSVSPRVYRPASLDDAGGWSNPAPQPFGSRSKSYTLGRDGSLRRNMRQDSNRTANLSGKSPASTFLSLWSRDEAPSNPDDEGQVVGTDYVIGKQIGFGGFSTVKEAFKVNEEGGPERSAVKIVKKHLAGQSERENDQVQAEFDHEVRIWRYLHHPHILPLDAVYETDYATFCFTRLTTRGTLFDLVRRHRQGLEMNLARNYAYQLASAIRYLHEDARVVHRDIKLENCLLDAPATTEDWGASQLILCDFGMAEWMTTDNGGNSSPDPYDNAADRPPPKAIGPSDTSTSVAGSLEYASPELLSSVGGLLNPIVDIWAFGVVVFALVVGSRPFQHAFKPRIKMNIMNGRWDRSAVLKGQGDPQERRDALDLIQGCLEMDPVRRWTIREVLESRWLQPCSNSADDPSDEPQWRF
ncbi:serine/threonine-protein kinase [Paracoccidioides lutzii Pb01]|uniref:Serine/threonine-protein kinase n=1 Tax=Paracoccidioides lutzii (strain ATCC MYA-826 / Pb01) TaxID=502779 RepID=C1GWR7_PARBA|nr:serine/threonine-protein kinase [Paracoccidioides lutzii Pb01]EEH40986.1 serine/threonine-protein kinase [Paracoccidioides lutzii Pb01]